VEDATGSISNSADFIVHNVLGTFEYSDYGAVVTVVDPRGTRIRLHVTVATAEMLCEHIAEALEKRYGQ
jgi:hypothetical protein